MKYKNEILVTSALVIVLITAVAASQVVVLTSKVNAQYRTINDATKIINVITDNTQAYSSSVRILAKDNVALQRKIILITKKLDIMDERNHAQQEILKIKQEILRSKQNSNKRHLYRGRIQVLENANKLLTAEITRQAVIIDALTQKEKQNDK